MNSLRHCACVQGIGGTSFEPLETRRHLSASDCAGNGAVEQLDAAPALHIKPAVTNTTPIGYTPAQVRHGYGFDNITFAGGTVQGDGSGQTIAIVDAYDEPNITADLAKFSTQFGLS